MLSFSDSTGNLFNRLGKLAKLFKVLRTYQTDQFTNLVDNTTGVIAQYSNEPDIEAMIGNNYIGAMSTPEPIASLAQQVAQATINRMVYRDNPLVNQSLTSQNVLGSILEVIRQMKILGATVQSCTVTTSTGTFTGLGDGILNLSVIRPEDGRTNEFALSETLTAVCLSDSYTGGETAGNESFQITGQGRQSDLFGYDWPKGSNALVQLNAINPSGDNAQGNILTNSDFENWSVTDIPDNYTIVVGAPSVDVFEENSLVEGESHAIRIQGDGATQVQLTQRFGSSVGTLGDLDTQTTYSISLSLRRGGTVLSSGVLTIDLVDQDTNVLLDANGVANSYTIDLTGLSVEYTAYPGVFRTGQFLPDFAFLRFRCSTPVNSGGLLYLEKMGMGIMTPLYTGGPYAAIHSAGVPFQAGDYAYATVTNSRGPGGTLDTWQVAFMRLMDPYILSNNILLPSSSTPTISDNLLS